MFATVEEGGGDDDLVMNLFNKLLTFKCGEKGEGVGEGVDEGVARELSYGDLRKWVFPAGTSAGNTVVVPESEIKQVIQQTEEKKEVVHYWKRTRKRPQSSKRWMISSSKNFLSRMEDVVC